MDESQRAELERMRTAPYPAEFIEALSLTACEALERWLTDCGAPCEIAELLSSAVDLAEHRATLLAQDGLIDGLELERVQECVSAVARIVTALGHGWPTIESLPSGAGGPAAYLVGEWRPFWRDAAQGTGTAGEARP